MAEWPEPEADPEEGRRWWARVALVGVVGAGAVLIAGNSEDGGSSWRLPEFELPAFELPSFEMPEVSLPDLRGRSSPNNAPPATRDAISQATGAPTDGAPFTRPASREECMGTIDGAAQAFGRPSLIEDTQESYLARFKLLDGQLNVTCANDTITIEQRG